MTTVLSGSPEHVVLTALYQRGLELDYLNQKWGRYTNASGVIFVSERLSDIAGELGHNPSGEYLTVEERLSKLESFDTVNYGVVVNDAAQAANNVTAIRAALEAAHAAGGGRVVFPEGTVYISTSSLIDPGNGYYCVFQVYPNIVLKGAGINLSTLKIADSQAAYQSIIVANQSTGADNFELCDLTIDQNYTNNPHNGSDVLTYYRMAVAIFKGNYVHIHNCRFTNYSSLNCVVINASDIKGAKIRNNLFDNFGGATAEHDHSGIYSNNRSCLIESNRFEGIAGGKGAICAVEVHGDQQIVVNNHFKQVYTGVNLTGVSTSSVGSIVAHNTIEDVRFGILLYSSSSNGSTIGLENALVDSNTIIVNADMWYDIWTDGVYAQAIGLGGGWDLSVKNLTISNNNCRLKPFSSPTTASDNIGSMIGFYDPLPNDVEHSRIKIINNIIDGAMAAGIRLTGKFVDFEVAGNQIRNVGLAANVNSGYKCGLFIAGPYAKYGRVHDNSVLDDQGTPTTSNAIFLSADTVTDCECVNNRTHTVNGVIGHIYGGDAYAKAWLIRHSLPTYATPAYPARPGSVLTDLSNGKQYQQVDNVNGDVWVPVSPNNGLALSDGLSTPSTIAGYAILFVDVADGDLKVKFGDGTVKLIVTDS